jgi:hypothetical protein
LCRMTKCQADIMEWHQNIRSGSSLGLIK